MPGAKRTTTDAADRPQNPDHDPALKPAEAKRGRFGKVPAWMLLPRDVAIGLTAVVAAGVIILGVLSWQ